MRKKKTEWKIESVSYPLADTGDYESYYELSIGDYKLRASEELEDEDYEKIEKALQLLNEVTMCWFDPYDGINDHIIGHQKETINNMQNYLEKEGLWSHYMGSVLDNINNKI